MMASSTVEWPRDIVQIRSLDESGVDKLVELGVAVSSDASIAGGIDDDPSCFGIIDELACDGVSAFTHGTDEFHGIFDSETLEADFASVRARDTPGDLFEWASEVWYTRGLISWCPKSLEGIAVVEQEQSQDVF